ncbi:MAG: TVP38/TMEM64 family protein [Bacilli bacterium]|nr:TVP38/TMEM64 family protein [Bacilli bacterium]
MNTLTELIDYATQLIQDGGLIIGFLLIVLEAFIPILPLGAFVTLNINAFGSFIGLLLSWTATATGSFLMYLLCYYVSNKIIYKFIKETTKEKIINTTEHFKKIKLTSLVLIITLPFTPSCFVNLIAGISNVSKEKYFISLLIGKVFHVIFWGYIGMSLIESITNIKAIIFIIIILIIAYIISKIISKKFKIE